jgi:hypothetical protein
MVAWRWFVVLPLAKLKMEARHGASFQALHALGWHLERTVWSFCIMFQGSGLGAFDRTVAHSALSAACFTARQNLE